MYIVREGINMLMIAVVLAVVTSVMMILGIALCCRRKGEMRNYEIVSVLSPTKYLASAGLISAKGWKGDSASDIPASLFPKHVQVYRSSDWKKVFKAVGNRDQVRNRFCH